MKKIIILLAVAMLLNSMNVLSAGNAAAKVPDHVCLPQAALSCESDADCFDDDPCSLDICDSESGSCVFDPNPECIDNDDDGYTADEDCDDTLPTVYPGATEECDGVDNDCDGAIDGLYGAPCLLQDGVCAGSAEICFAGQVYECSLWTYLAHNPYYEPIEATCDGYDNDCDGGVDIVDIDGDGQMPYACQGLDCDDTRSNVLTDGIEYCDELDNDCNGIVDDVDNDDDGEYSANCGGSDCDDSNPDIYSGATEVCDGEDNNCNGQADEDFEGLGEICTVGIGECLNIGLTECNSAGTGTVCSATFGAASAEICDGLDNDCNGQIDEGITASYCSNQQGVCVGAVEYCSGIELSCGSDSFENAAQNNGGTYEVVELSCDGLDNDCDGLIDENLGNELCPLQDGVCLRSRASCDGNNIVCDANAYGPDYETDESLCDGLDNDCDGVVDEGYNVHEICYSGLGACEAVGITQCTATGDGTECSAQWGTPSPELCDGIDNDCDGTVDDPIDLSAPPCPEQDGVCAGSAATCGGFQGWLVCGPDEYGSLYESIEVTCDNEDNDCDGIVNEGCDLCTPGDYIYSQCGTSDTGLCQLGTQVSLCDVTNTWVAIGECDGAVKPVEEVCDSLDNDCDGQADEDGVCFECEPGAAEQQDCGTLDVGLCQFGTETRTCDQTGQWSNFGACEGAVYPATEVCDGDDNDCDGQADEFGSCAPTSYTNSVSCVSAECQINSCFTRRYDLDGVYSNGCECYDTEVASQSFNAIYLGEISDTDGVKFDETGVIPNSATPDWYEFTFDGAYLASTEFYLLFKSPTGTSMKITLYNSNLVSRDTATSSGSTVKISDGDLTDGTYFIKVELLTGESCNQYRMLGGDGCCSADCACLDCNTGCPIL